MEELNKNIINNKISRIMDDCNDTNIKSRLQLVYDRLNGKNYIKPVNFIQKFKNAIYMLNPKYRKEIEITKLKIAEKDLRDIVGEYIITDKIFNNKVLNEYQSELSYTIDRLLSLHFGVNFNEKDNSLKRYDIKITDKIKKLAYGKVITHMQEEYLCDEIKLKDLIIKEIDTYKQKIEDIKEKAKEMKIQPYYGNEDFIKYRISFIIQCIEKMLNKPRFKDRKDIQKHYEYVKKIYRDCKEITLDIDSIEEQKINYEKLENLYLKVLEIENILSKDVEQVWKETMKEKNSKEGQMAYFAHSLTEGEFNPEDMNKVCVTYVTEKTLTIPYGDYGFLYEMDMDNIIQIAAEDAGSWKVDKEKFIDNDLSTFWQFEEPIDEEGNRIFFEYPPRNSKLLLPDDVEQETINENIQRNGEMLDYDKRNVYNEAVIINKNKKMMPIGVFVKIIGNEENSDKMQKAKALSEKFGLELKIFDKSVLRERLGLKPLTEGEMKKGSKEKEF